MVYKTLHWYIFRELLRIFLLTASALTTLLAFGGTFKPVTKQGIEITQLMTIISNLMPAMLAYAIPIAALFAAVLVYWRLATDNEMTACRASGISFVAIVMPALALGLLVASVDLVFVNYVVPVFLQRTERAIISDLGSLVTNQINQQGQFKYENKLVLYADSAEQQPTTEPNTSEVVLHGMAALKLKDGKPDVIVVARQANGLITNDPVTGEAAIKFTLMEAAAFNPATMSKISGSVPALTEGGKPFIVASQLKSKPKFLNVSQLFNYDRNPMLFQPVRDIVDQLETLHEYQVVAERLYGAWNITGGAPMTLEMTGPGGSTAEFVKITAPRAELNPEKQLVFLGTPGKQVHVERYQGKTLTISYNCGAVDVQLAEDDLSGEGITGTLLLRDHVTRTDHLRRIGPDPSDVVTLSGLVLPAGIATVAPTDPQELVKSAAKSNVKSMQKLSADVRQAASTLFQEIDSELHSRGSFSLSCLTLVMLGAALGLLMRGKNPLAVFVIGFVPAILLVLLITAGRQMAEGSARNEHMGLGLIWAGNVVLLGILIAVYSKLVRQ
jgi:lipopolysaccharide export system permease protein